MTNLPQRLQSILIFALTERGDFGPIQQVRSVGGGCINNASQILTPKASYFLKWNNAPLPNLFTTEAYGLRLLKEMNTIRIPEVFKAQEAHRNTMNGCMIGLNFSVRTA